jgi:hypothetical protein
MKIIASAVVVMCLLIVVLFLHYGKKGTPPIQVANAIVTCTQTVCEAQATSPACTQLGAAVVGCLSSGINAAVCLAGLPALANVGYADVVCVVNALASAPSKTIAYRTKSANKSGEILDETPNIQQQAIKWLSTQQVIVNP